MSGHKSQLGAVLVAYALTRRTLTRLTGKQASLRRRLVVLACMVVLVGPFAGPILWHALLTMPTALVVLIGSAVTFRVVRWFWRRYQ